MIEKYLDRVIDLFTTGDYYAEVFKAKQEFFAKAGEIFDDDLEFEHRMCIFMDWYLFDRDLPGVDLPPIKYFFKLYQNAFQNDELNIYRDLCSTVHSIFILKRFSFFGEGLNVQDLFSNKKYKVIAPAGKAGFSTGDIFEARILKFKNQLFFSKGFCFHPVEMKAFILKEIKKVRYQERPKQTKLILQLAGMKLDHTRLHHIDIAQIYSFESRLRTDLQS